MLLSQVVMATSKHTKSGDFEEAFKQFGEEMTDIWYVLSRIWWWQSTQSSTDVREENIGYYCDQRDHVSKKKMSLK